MRYQEDHKEKTHAKIVERAAQEFRLNGFDGVGIAKLMGKLGLSHGGFYAHFEDKEDLKDQAMESALDYSRDMAERALKEGGIEGYIEYYTGDLHLNHPEFGCILATLSAEEGRRSSESRAKFAEKYTEIAQLIAEYLPGPSADEQTEQAHFILSTLSGSIALARATGDPTLTQTILRSARAQLTLYLRSR
jgi:TetR/AcrR family transcriptional repressor of nem operon